MVDALGEKFNEDERRALSPYFTNLDGPVFALVNLPEVVKGALFARYSRSAKSLRRLFLDEFRDKISQPPIAGTVGLSRARRLYEKVLNDYGDDSVAQLGGVHLACEGVSNILTKILERGRLAAYLEQSTRYVPYTDQVQGRWKYHVPGELQHISLRKDYVEAMDRAFETYAELLPRMQVFFSRTYPKQKNDSETVYSAAIRSKALDSVRGLLPAATKSNMGIYASGQAYETLLLRMQASELIEVQDYARLMIQELNLVIPEFLQRLDRPERGGVWTHYLKRTRREIARKTAELIPEVATEYRSEVVLTDFDPEGEIKVVAAILYETSTASDDHLFALSRNLTSADRQAIIKTYVGVRGNRRHKPGRAFERTSYRFDVLADYGSFRDLQRHRMLTLDWQSLSPYHGYVVPEAIEEAGFRAEWERAMDQSCELHEALMSANLPFVAPYAVLMAYRIRFYMQMNAREAMHIIELRTTPQGHPNYRRICQAMHDLIGSSAGHHGIAAAISFVDHSPVDLGRLDSERASERRKSENDRQGS